MADFDTLQMLMKGAQAVAPMGQGFVDRDAARYNADVLRTQRRAVLSSAAAEESLQRRQGRSLIAQQVANMAKNGVGADSSQADVVRQNEVNLIADALAIRHRGEIEAAGYESRARMAEYEGEQSFYHGLQGSASQLLTTTLEQGHRDRLLARGRGYRTGLKVS